MVEGPSQAYSQELTLPFEIQVLCLVLLGIPEVPSTAFLQDVHSPCWNTSRHGELTALWASARRCNL